MVIDHEKRRRVMQRSQQLGHCVCEPRRPCPCLVFTEQHVCPCAGERPAPTAGVVKLTEMVRQTGCAAKIAPRDLEAVLARLPAINDPAIISGIPAGDDAGVYRLADGACLVQTVDVMPPCVDDAFTFGRICAANCVSDIYAMGGIPRTALSILAFPAETLDSEIMYQMMRGAMATLAEAGVALIGGHSLKDEEIKLGFAITGTIAPDALVEHATARVGDRLVLTKPLGTGVLGFARQIGRQEGDWEAAVTAMATLNRAAAEAMTAVGVSAATDITGFGLFGHLMSMARHSGVTARITADGLPAFAGALDLLRAGVIPGAVERNREYIGEALQVADGVEDAWLHLGLDAQTSGGLLIAVPAARHAALLDALQARGVAAYTIGEITGPSAGGIEVITESAGQPAPRIPAIPPQEKPVTAEQAFGALMRAVAGDGAVDARTKELITFALVVHSRCAPCLKTHVKKAHALGITDAELEEVVWCAVAMGGAPVRMFYQETMHALEEETAHSCC